MDTITPACPILFPPTFHDMSDRSETQSSWEPDEETAASKIRAEFEDLESLAEKDLPISEVAKRLLKISDDDE